MCLQLSWLITNLQGIKLVMIDSELSPRKHTSQTKKHSLSQKTRSDYPSPHSPQQVCPALVTRPAKTLGRKYAQQHLFKLQQKQHHEIVISDEVVRNSKLYRMLKEKIQIGEHKFVKQSKQLIETKQKLAQEVAQINQNNHHTKLTLWELKNQILQLKAMLIDQEDEARHLESQVANSQQPPYGQQEEEAEQQMPNQQQGESGNLSQEEFDKNQYSSKHQWLQIESGQLKQEEKDIKVIMSHLHRKIGLNPEQQKERPPSKLDKQAIE